MAPKDGLIHGEITRELWEEFEKHAVLGVLGLVAIRPLLNHIGLFPTKSQVHELVHAACEGSGRTPVDHVTFGEFCILVTELQESYRKNPPAPMPRSQLADKAVLALKERRRRRRLSANFKVFLGGSCNPTTWRHDTAIPFLKQHNITFYNPQVSNWKPELMEIEDQAKQTAELLFFVIDNQTRSTASMVEASYLAGCGRQLILIIKKFGENVVIAGEPVSPVEVEDLERSHAYLTDLVERQGIPVFNDMDTALNCTRKAIQQNVRVSELSLDDGAQPVKYPYIRVADRFMKLRDVYNAISNHSPVLNLNDLNLAYRTITDEPLPASFLREQDEAAMYTFEQFCCIVSEMRYRRKSLWRRMIGGVFRLPNRMYDWFRSVPLDHPELDTRKNDVFLGGTCGKSTWREDIAVPMLRKHGMTYFNPQLQEWSTRYIPMEAQVKDSCRLLLYVVTGDTRAIGSLLEVGHYIGQGCNIVLCLQNIPDEAQIGGEKLTDYSVKDYNRARTYLGDLANRDGIPVFSDITEAVQCVVTRLKGENCATLSS